MVVPVVLNGSGCPSVEASDLLFVVFGGGSDGFDGCSEVADFGGQPGQGPGFALVGAVLVDDRSEFVLPVEGGPAQAGAGGDCGEGDRAGRGRPGRCRPVRPRVALSRGLGLRDERVESSKQDLVSFGFADPATLFGVRGRRGVDSLGGQDLQVAGVGTEVRAVFTDVRVGARSLRRGLQAVAAGHPGLDRPGRLSSRRW